MANARFNFLERLTRNQLGIRTASDFGKSGIVRRLARAFLERGGPAYAFGPQLPVDNNAWGRVEGILVDRVGTHTHPLHGRYERLTVVHFDAFIGPAVAAMNVIRGIQQHFEVGRGVYTNINEQTIRVTGRSGCVIRCNGRPCCIVEHKQYRPRSRRLFDEGRDQALVYAAAIGHELNLPAVLAIVTDLHHWRFLVVAAGGYRESVEFLVNYDPHTGLPVGQELADMVRRTVDLRTWTGNGTPSGCSRGPKQYLGIARRGMMHLVFKPVDAPNLKSTQHRSD